jgi:hypothetical protein
VIFGVFREIFGNGVVGNTDNTVFIGLLRFWAKNEGKKAPKIKGN